MRRATRVDSEQHTKCLQCEQQPVRSMTSSGTLGPAATNWSGMGPPEIGVSLLQIPGHHGPPLAAGEEEREEGFISPHSHNPPHRTPLQRHK